MEDSGAEAAAESRYQVRTRWEADLLAVTLMLVFVTGAVTLSLLAVVTTQLSSEIGLSDAQIGLLTSVFMGFYGVSGITSGIVAARWGGRLIAVTCGCFVVGSLIFALSSGMAGFLVGRAIQGLGGGMVIAICSPVLAHSLPPAWLDRAWGILGSGWGLGTVAALLIMPSIQKVGGYRAVFLTTAALGLVVGVAALLQRPVRARPIHPEGATTVRGLARATAAVVTNRRVLILGLINAAALATGVGILQWTPQFLQDLHGSSEAVSVYLVAGLGAAQLVGNPLGAAASSRWGKFAVIVWSIAVMLLVTAAVGISPGAAVAFVLVLLAGFFSMTYFPPMISYIPEVVTEPWQVGPATGVNTAMGFAGSMIAPWLFGLFLDVGERSRGAYISGYLMLAVFGVAALVGMAFFRKARAQAGTTRRAQSGTTR